MKKVILALGLIFGFLSQTNAAAPVKPPHYDDWKVTVDKVTKKTSLKYGVPNHWPEVPGMGDKFTIKEFRLIYSFQGFFTGTPGTPTAKVSYYLVFQNNIAPHASLAVAIANKLFRYSDKTQLTLLLDDQNMTLPAEKYSTDQDGGLIYEEIRIPVTLDLMNKMLAAKQVSGNLNADSESDEKANKSFTFEKSFKEILNSFLYRANEIQTPPAAAPAATPAK